MKSSCTRSASAKPSSDGAQLVLEVEDFDKAVAHLIASSLRSNRSISRAAGRLLSSTTTATGSAFISETAPDTILMICLA
jgi:hypothetical protein